MSHAALTQESSHASAFNKFRELPAELRVKIWQHAMPEARTIAIKAPPTTYHEPLVSLEGAMFTANEDVRPAETWQSAAQVPALLHVNSEARHEAHKHYHLALGVGKAQPRIYVDFARDTIFIGHEQLRDHTASLWASTQDLSKIQRLAIVPEGAWRVLTWGKADLDALLKIIFVDQADDVELGAEPHLVEDVPREIDAADVEAQLGQAPDVVQGQAQSQASRVSLESCLTKYYVPVHPMKQRMQAAREELDTLMHVLPTLWEKEPIVSTAVFKRAVRC